MLLPLFPLKLVVFPGENVRLHIFEPRYKQLIQECNVNKICFGMPAVIDGKISEFGTELSLEDIAKTYPGGEMDIITQGKRVFRVLDFHRVGEGNLYPTGEVEFLIDEPQVDVELQKNVFNLVKSLFDEIGEPGKMPLKTHSFEAFELGPFIGLSLEEKMKLLGEPKEQNRMKYIFQHLSVLLPTLKKTRLIKDRANQNGHFHEFDSLDF